MELSSFLFFSVIVVVVMVEFQVLDLGDDDSSNHAEVLVSLKGCCSESGPNRALLLGGGREFKQINVSQICT